MSDATKHAALIAAHNLPNVVAAAIKAANVRVEGAGSLVIHWDLAGKVVRDWAEGEKLAEVVSRHVSDAGHAAVPAVLSIDKRIIAGFIERIAVPQLRQL